jgi:polyisoprenoid-binding protein YceI
METLVKTTNPTLTKWNLDAAHSGLEFSVKHLMISTVKGNFKNFNMTLESEGEDFSKARVEAEIQVDSIHTGQENREAHLKSADFFDAVNFPTAAFKSTSVEKGVDGNLKVNGELTIKGITKPVTVNVEFNGTGTDPYGNEKAGFEFSTAINRNDYGLSWNVPLEAGGVMVSNQVKIFGGLQFAKQKEA